MDHQRERRLPGSGQLPRCRALSEIEAQGDLAKKLHEIAGDEFRRLFTGVRSYQLAENFRAEAAAFLPESKAEALGGALRK